MKAILILILSLFVSSNAFADEAIFGDYNSDIKSDAQAKNNKFLKAKSDNTKYRIKNKLQKNGKIITYDSNTDSLIGVTLEQGSKAGDIFMDTNFGSNNTIIIEEKKY